jgi:lipid-binding SYLF domain-containing protein
MRKKGRGLLLMMTRLMLILFVSIFVMSSSALSAAAEDAIERVDEARIVFEEIMDAPDKGIPRDLLEKAHCIVIIPAVKRGGFIVGAQYGKGLASCRQPDGSGWTGPSTVRMEGGSVGFQIGAGEMDVVMMVMNESGARKLLESEFTLGGEGAVMAGPVGRSATAETDAYLRAEILSYSRSRGLFAGLVVKGATLRSDDEDNETLYGVPVKHDDILRGQVPASAAAAPLIKTLTRYSAAEDKPVSDKPSPAERVKE